MGVPLIVAGVSAGKLLPKAGEWMNAVKAVFGVMLLAVAIYLLERVVPEPVALLLWAALFIVCAIYMGALDSLTPDSGGWRRCGKVRGSSCWSTGFWSWWESRAAEGICSGP